jgi:tetratricopeptide (TPR) repeat protein
VMLILASVLASCTLLNRAPDSKDKAEDIAARAKRYIAQGRYDLALETYMAAQERHRQNKVLKQDFARAVGQIREAGDRFFSEGEFAAAGNIYYTLSQERLQRYDVYKLAIPDKNYLVNRIRSCSRALTDQGLAMYRDGDLDKAISLWNKVLRIDPDNREVRRAIETAHTQRENLKRMQRL